MFDFNKVLGIIRGATGAFPIVRDLVQAFLPLLGGTQQAELQSALEEARARSDEAEDEFVKASRGK